MSVVEVKMYKVVCDHPDCDVETSDLGGEYTAWADHSWAVDEWITADCQYVQIDEHGSYKTYCGEHRIPVCEVCEGLEDINDDGLCPACAVEWEKQQA